MKLASLASLLALMLVGCAADPGDDTSGPPLDGDPLVTPIGDPIGAPTTAVIGPDGGRAITPDGQLAIDVPPGAVTAPTTFTIQPVTNLVPGGLGTAYRLEPEGQTFAAPVTLTFGYDAAALGDNDPDGLIVAFQTATGGWNPVGAFATDPAAHTVSVHAPHFSLWSLSTGFTIDPVRSTVPTAGTQPLEFQMCWTEPSDCVFDPANGVIENNCSLVCQRNLADIDLEWAVDGVVGGTLNSGTIAPVPRTSHAVFNAPVRAPDPDTVQVSARCTGDCTPRGTVIAFAQVKIEDKPWYVGHVNTASDLDDASGSWHHTTAATVTFAYDSYADMYLPREGTLYGTMNITAAGCTTHAQYEGPLGADDGRLSIIGTVYYGIGLETGSVLTGTASCEGGSSPVSLPAPLTWWPNPASGPTPIEPDGTLAGTDSYTNPAGMVTTWDWYLEPIDPDQAE